MNAVTLTKLSELAREARDSSKDPIFKMTFGLLCTQLLNLRKGAHGSALPGIMMNTVRGLERTIAERRS